ncbi:MAG: dihydroneopterin aldolase [Pseudomonadota bacterium]
MSLDVVRIQGLAVETVIGVWAWEREITQKLLVDIELYTDTRAAGASDALEDALNYAAVAERVTNHIQAAKAQLIERLANELATLLLDEFEPQRVVLTVRKPGAVPAASDVAVQVARERNSISKA